MPSDHTIPLDRDFRRGTYLTLAAATACLGYAECSLLPEVGVFAGVVFLALGGLYAFGKRIRLLSVGDANKLAVAIAVAAMTWGIYRVVREMRYHEFAGMGWQLMLVALVGPLLLSLIPAKLLRREKNSGDYWQLHGIALAGVCLAGVLSPSAVGVGLTAAYAAFAGWGLSVFYLARTAGSVPASSGRNPESRVAAAPGVMPIPREARWGGARVLLAAGLAVPLFLLVPRSNAPRFDLGQPRIEIGYAADQMVDLNRTGSLQANPEPAFEVSASMGDQPKLDLSPNQLWRGGVHVDYVSGNWRRGEVRMPTLSKFASRPPVWSPPDFGPNRFKLTFSVPGSLGLLPLANPVLWVQGQPSPIATIAPEGMTAWHAASNGSFYAVNSKPSGPAVRYVQYLRPAADPALGPAFELADRPDWDTAISPLLANPVPRVKEYADQVVIRAIRNGRIPAAAQPRADPSGRTGRDQVRLGPAEEYHERIAREFVRHLSMDGGLMYSVELRRENREVDPVEDFLFYIKTGHCQRFATALVLMLRSQGIPAAYVLGFQGCEPTKEAGRFLVRQEHAHAWAEALISRPGPAGPVWHWLTLNPSPAEAPDAPPADWWNDVVARGKAILFSSGKENGGRWRNIDVSPQAWRWGWLAAACAAAAIAFGARRRHFRSKCPDAPARLFDRIERVLIASGHPPLPGETPAEFAVRIRGDLPAHIADVPLEWARAYYAMRFGGVTIAEAAMAQLERGLEHLETATR